MSRRRGGLDLDGSLVANVLRPICGLDGLPLGKSFSIICCWAAIHSLDGSLGTDGLGFSRFGLGGSVSLSFNKLL